MSNYGLKITNPNDGVSFIFNEKTSPCAIIWSRAVEASRGDILKNPTVGQNGFWYDWECPVKIPSGYRFTIIKSGGMAIVKRRYTGRGVFFDGALEMIQYSENNGIVTVSGLGDDTQIFVDRLALNNLIKIIAWPDPKLKTPGLNYGLRVAGNTVFLNEKPPMGYGYAFHKKKMNINGIFNPKDVDPSLTIDNAIFFFYTDNSDAIMRAREDYSYLDYSVWSEYVCINKKTGKEMSANWWVVAFTNPKGNELSGGTGGLRIRNIKGEITFSSYYGVLSLPVQVPGNNFFAGKAVSLPNIKRPMYMPTVVGQSIFQPNYDWWNWVEERWERPTNFYWIGELCLGNNDKYSLSLFNLARVQDGAGMQNYKDGYREVKTSQPILILDAESHFKF
ncbi:hypothetical protein LGZ99_20605 [Photorhabdus temperata]|uniref:hypothetical protein n=1 Tax=Photorhabdus temperata TaxID=574560 RepID=UPI0021D4CC93|nr:hypothetical protein [Photorhabdus temperata]MCT8349530.1 hypothetical protein [Photorhabdus temperata]